MRQVLIIVCLLLLLTLIGTIGIHSLTDSTWLEACYIAVVTLSTVGSRDVPSEPAPMIFVMIYLVCGLGVFTYSAFQLGQIVVNANLRNLLTRRRMERQLNNLSDHYIVCGAGRMGTAICEYLAGRRQTFVMVDQAPEVLEAVCGSRNWLYVQGDATDDQVLRQAGIDRARALAAALPEDADNVYVVLSARLLSARLQIVARANDVAAIQKLQRAGATRVISPINSGAVKMARFMLTPRIEDFLEIAGTQGHDLEMVELQVDPDSPYVGKTLTDTDWRQRGIMVIGIRRADGKYVLAPSGSTTVQSGDSLIAFGSSNAVDAMVNEPGVE